MQKTISCLLLFFIFTSTYGQDKKDWRPFVEIDFGVIANVLSPDYSISSPYLKKPVYTEVAATLVLKVGAVFKKKHFFAVGVENMLVDNGFFYERQDSSGNYIGNTSTKKTTYAVFGFYYDYALISFKRFQLLAGIQTNLGIKSGSTSYYNDYGGVLSGTTVIATYKERLHEQKDPIFIYGVGISCSFDIIKEKLILGVGAKFTHAPYAVVKSYHITYKYINEAPLDFYTSNGMMNVNFDLRLKYVF